ncbi:MAG: class I SAM-dependent rRNA methyltransferase [Deltaproteobacteria bacterium]|nr:class I SAM-dependent rRNA methyltransferase [Deltaproteobacteria bacterium]
MEKRITITKKGWRWWRSGHPWLYRDDLLPGQSAAPGDIVAVQDEQGRFLGQALYSATSRIALRFLTGSPDPVDRVFWGARLSRAVAYRRRVVQDTDAFRLVYAEADGFPGLIVDSYNGNLVMQVHHPGMARLLPDLVDLLHQQVQPASITLRNDSEVRRLEGLPLEVEVISGHLPEPLIVREGPVQFLVDVRQGQKTGLFLDQRENRRDASVWAQGDVLDCFSYQGGFALHAARLARRVVAVEASAFSLAVAQENARLNGVDKVEWVQANCFDFLKEAQAAGQTFDMIILDPPAFAKSRGDRPAGQKGYLDLNRRALHLLKPGGILITCSCSYNLAAEAFLEVLRQAARESRRQVRLVECRGAARDHPVLLALPESSYLKCFFGMAL